MQPECDVEKWARWACKYCVIVSLLPNYISFPHFEVLASIPDQWMGKLISIWHLMLWCICTKCDAHSSRRSTWGKTSWSSPFSIHLSLSNDFFSSALHVVFEVGAPHAALQKYSAWSRSTIFSHLVPELGAPYAAPHEARLGEVHWLMPVCHCITICSFCNFTAFIQLCRRSSVLSALAS